jgi:hypothetical protein
VRPCCPFGKPSAQKKSLSQDNGPSRGAGRRARFYDRLSQPPRSRPWHKRHVCLDHRPLAGDSLVGLQSHRRREGFAKVGGACIRRISSVNRLRRGALHERLNFSSLVRSRAAPAGSRRRSRLRGTILCRVKVVLNLVCPRGSALPPDRQGAGQEPPGQEFAVDHLADQIRVHLFQTAVVY